MNKRILRAFVAMGALATACASWGCVADRPSRNGVYNENQYIRKDFLIRSGNGGSDPGWFMKTTIVSTSTPNPFMASPNSLFNGQESAVAAGTTGVMPYVRWVITSDKLQVVNMRELSGATLAPPAQGTREPEVLNAWPIVNVDLKYEINLDGEITNFFSENQEADWQQRQWVKVSFDKNDFSDIAPMGEGVVAFLEQCGDMNVSTTLVPGSFLVDEANNYMTWQVQMTVPVSFSDTNCVSFYGTVGQEFSQFGRQDVTMTMMYSFVRADALSGKWDPTPAPDGRGCTQNTTSGAMSCPASTYVPWVMSEKDPIQHKYGLFHAVSMDRDPNTDLLTAQAYIQRLNPNQTWPYTLYLSAGYPSVYEVIFCGYQADGFTPATNGTTSAAAPLKCGDPHTGGIVDQMNQIWTNAGAKLQMRVMHNDDLTVYGDHANPNPKVFGDVRYSFIRFITDFDSTPPGLLGVTEPLSDPRTGEMLTNTINITNTNIQDFYAARLEFYLETIGGTGGSQTGNPYALNANGTDWANTPGGACTVGDLIPLGGTGTNGFGIPNPDNNQNGAVQTGHNFISTVFQKMQQYLHKPIPNYGYLGPDDFVPQEDTDFFAAYYKIIPYEIYRDPATNPFVIPEGGTGNYGPNSAQGVVSSIQAMGQFNTLMAAVDKGQAPLLTNGQVTGNFNVMDVGGQGPAEAALWTQQWQTLSQGYTNSRWALAAQHPGVKADMAGDVLSYFNNFEHAGRHCVQNAANTTPHWESLTEWVNDLTLSTWSYTIWHEFGHSMGLDHNFMGSNDRNNWSHWKDGKGNDQIGMFSSSIMEYPTNGGDLFFKGGVSEGPGAKPVLDPSWNGKPGWLPYDVAAISFIYANAQTAQTAVPSGPPCVGSSTCSSASGQISGTKPWLDPMGWNGGTENPFLWCSDEHVRYSPFCQTFDFGTTPSEIIASALDEEEWQYKWTNFRLYHKYWDDSGYAGGRANFYHDILRFLSAWAFDWNPATLPGQFIKLGVVPPPGVPEQDYYANLLNEFTNDISIANQLVAAFHHGMVEQASGERPFITEFDPFYGDVIQQGIIIDKNYAVTNFTTLYPVDNFDPTQAAGAYLTATAGFDNNYQSIAQSTVNDFVGGQFAAFLYDAPLAAQNFAMMTQNPYFPGSGGEASIRDWIGSKVFGGGEIDPNAQYLGWAHALAAQYGFGCDKNNQNCGIGGANVCVSWNDDCTWDPRTPQINADDVFHSDPFNEFRGPDNRRYAWCPITDRNQQMVVDRDWNTATYILVRTWNTDVTYDLDDGSGGNAAYQLELPLKYYINSYNQYN